MNHILHALNKSNYIKELPSELSTVIFFLKVLKVWMIEYYIFKVNHWTFDLMSKNKGCLINLI